MRSCIGRTCRSIPEAPSWSAWECGRPWSAPCHSSWASFAIGIGLYVRATTASDAVGQWGLWTLVAFLLVMRSPGTDGAPFAELLQHGSLSVEIFAPRGVDTQEPHSRDELYVVVEGRGDFLYGSRRARVSPGDFLFVPARLEHRFENSTSDLTLWVVFFGPEGGERA